MEYSLNAANPAGRLVPIFAGEDGLASAVLAYELATHAASRGDNVLIVDCDEGRILNRLAIKPKADLNDVLNDNADINDAKNITPGGLMTLSCGGEASLEDLLGALAAMSLSHDWVFVLPRAGCTPAHVKLAAASDQCVMMFHSAGDRFMRAYWMLDAIRTRAPRVDPLMVVQGPKDEAHEAYEMFAGTVREFLGAPPPLADMIECDDVSKAVSANIIEALEQAIANKKAA